MDCCMKLSEEEKEAKRNHRKIEKQLKKDKKKQSKDIKLLLLGAGESGKTTFVKQMRILYKGGFSTKEKKKFITIICQNMFTSMKAMIEGMDLLKINYDIPEIMDSVQLIKRIKVEASAFNDLNVYALKKLWAFDGIQESYKQRNLYQLIDSTKYFFLNIDRVTAEDYLPTNDDILYARVETKGIQEYDFPSKKYNIRITDIAGQRTQRKKWFPLLDKCNAMIFISAISEYDQRLMEDKTVNRLNESIMLFNNIINSAIFTNKPNILFLNKNDLLEIKIKESHLVDYFPEYEGQPRDVMAARMFIEKMFVNQKEETNGILYTFFTCATDTENIKNVFDAVQSAIIEKNLNNSVLI